MKVEIRELRRGWKANVLQLLLIPATLIPGPGFVQDVADGNTQEGFSTHGLMQSKTILIDATEVLALAFAGQVFARISFDNTAASAAAATAALPILELALLESPIKKVVRFEAHIKQESPAFRTGDPRY